MSQKIIRDQKRIVNNPYYTAITDYPKSGSFKNDYHFSDNEGRLYKIVSNFNKSIFTLGNNKTKKDFYKNGEGEKLECSVINNSIELFVKLPQKLEWFNMNKQNKIQIKNNKDDTIFNIIIVSYHCGTAKSRTGRIFVNGLNKTYCNNLLNTR